MKRNNWIKASILMAALAMSCLACSNPLWLNMIAPLGDDSNFVKGTFYIYFVNETPYRVMTYWGAYNPLDLDENTQVQKLVLEAGKQSSSPVSVTCTRQLVLAGSDLKYIVQQTKPEGISASDINDKINFSNVTDPDADNADDPTAGTADPITFFIGVDYSCGGSVEIHFKQDSSGNFYTEIAPYEEEEED